MQSQQLRQHHIESFLRLSVSERLAWVFSQQRFLNRFMDAGARLINRNIRRHGKRYFRSSDLAKDNQGIE